MNLEELLSAQTKSGFRATVEAIPEKPDLVKITPWSEGVGCLCHLAMNLSKSSVEGVTPTRDTHVCCGKTLKVVELHLKKGATMQVEDLFDQLNTSANRRASSSDSGNAEPMYAPGQGPGARGDPPPWGWGLPPWWHYPPLRRQMRFPDQFYALCESNYNRCLEHCAYSPNPEECECLCRSSLATCNHRPPIRC